MEGMSYTDWLRRQVTRLESEIRRHSVFERESPASIAELRELRKKAVLHTYLKQQLTRREVVQVEEAEEYETQEIVLVRR